MKGESHIHGADPGAPTGPRDGSRSAPRRKTSPIVVKKYANRRLYNTSTSSYVTLDNLAAMVRGQQDFVVTDAKTGEDITRSVLTQIIFDEEARGRAPMLPISFLRQLIRLYGDTLQAYVPGYLEMTMQAFERNQETFREQMERSFGKAPGFAQFEAMTRSNVEMFRRAMSLFAPFVQAGFEAMEAEAAKGSAPDAPQQQATAAAAGETPPAAPAAEKSGETRANDVDALKAELAAIQRKIEALGKG